MKPETIQGIRQVLNEVSRGLLIGHHITRLNSYGPELFSAFRLLLDSEPDDGQKTALRQAQSKLLTSIKMHMVKSTISPCIDSKEIDKYLDWLDNR